MKMQHRANLARHIAAVHGTEVVRHPEPFVSVPTFTAEVRSREKLADETAKLGQRVIALEHAYGSHLGHRMGGSPKAHEQATVEAQLAEHLR